MHYANGNEYNGDWAYGKFHGGGVFSWSDRNGNRGCTREHALTLAPPDYTAVAGNMRMGGGLWEGAKSYDGAWRHGVPHG